MIDISVGLKYTQLFSYRTKRINFGQLMCSIAEIILYHRYIDSKLSYPITGPHLLSYNIHAIMATS